MNKTSFRPQTNGFAFINSWTFEPGEEQEMKRSLAVSTQAATERVGNSLGAVMGMVTPLLNRMVANAAPKNYGLCGGMAAASLDYFQAGKPTPRGKSVDDLPDRSTAEGAELRKYLTDRQLESMAQNFPKLLAWMVMLHVDIPFYEGDGAAWLLARSKDEWVELKGRIDAGTPWPVMLIGSSASPFNNHQVLAYGYDDPDEGTATMFVYDMNCPGKENNIVLDFRGSVLQAKETCPDERRGPLRGFFCNEYRPAEPPDVTY
jgi:hypothetical protein